MTIVYSDYEDFLNRPYKDDNGVSVEFAELHPDWESDNEDNRGCWNCYACFECHFCANCSNCIHCMDCNNCQTCYASDHIKDCCGHYYAKSIDFTVPVVENIHQKILKEVSVPGAFNMNEYHTCDTTHCWAGWAIHLAGEAGYTLAKLTHSSAFAAMLIFNASSAIRVSPDRFFESNEKALSEIKLCAEKEALLQVNN